MDNTKDNYLDMRDNIGKINDLEAKFVSIMINERNMITYILSKCPIESFREGVYKQLAIVIESLNNTGDPIDIAVLKDRTDLTVTNIIDITETAFKNDYKQVDALLLKHDRLLRELKARTMDLPALVNDLGLDKARDHIIKELSSDVQVYKKYSCKEMMENLIDYELSPDAQQIYTGYKRLDEKVQIRSTNLIVIAGRPASGKTTFALNIINKMARAKSRVLFFSFEMNNIEIARKLKDINYGNEVDMSLTIIESAGLTDLEIKHIIIKEQPDIVFIDQLDCIPVNSSRDRHDIKIGEIVSRLKGVSMEIKIPIILLHQLNRGAVSGSDAPSVVNLKDSGIVEQKADCVLMLYPQKQDIEDDAKDETDVNLIIGKNRMGASGVLFFSMVGDKSLFTERMF